MDIFIPEIYFVIKNSTFLGLFTEVETNCLVKEIFTLQSECLLRLVNNVKLCSLQSSSHVQEKFLLFSIHMIG